MNIGLDYDGTITGDQPSFIAIVKFLRQRNHKVYIVTMRYPSEGADVIGTWGALVDGIYFTSRGAKEPFMQAAGIQIHVWIDDNPRAIHESAAQIWGAPSPEGTVVIPHHEVIA